MAPRRGLLDGGEDRYGLMSFGTKDIFIMRRKIRYWQKQFKQRHLFGGLMVLLLMCVITKFILMNMFSDQLDLDTAIPSNVVQDEPSPNNWPVNAKNYPSHILYHCHIRSSNFHNVRVI